MEADAPPAYAAVASIERVLREELGASWTVSPVAQSWTRRSFAATDGERRVFVKLDVRADVLRRLAELGVAPPLILSGFHGGQSLVVQEYIDGPPVERDWFAANVAALAALVAAYHDDVEVAALLTGGRPLSYRGVVQRTIADLRRRAATTSCRSVTSAMFRAAVARLAEAAEGLEEVPLVPTHGDPNRRNIVISAGRPYFVDWDEIALADPLRDIGQLLWWYLPREQWDEFLALSRIHQSPAALQRLYCWIASEFLDVSLTTAAAGLETDAQAFFSDVEAALDHRPNRRAG